MSVLETFFILFESDASKTTKDVNNLSSSLTGLAKNALAAGAAFLSISAISRSIMDAANFADNLNDVSQSLGVNIEELDAWGSAVQMSGGTAASFQQSLGNLVTSFAQISTTGKSRALPFFKELGISMTDSQGKVREVMDVLPELADAFAGLSKAQAFGMGQKLGLDSGTILLLQQGRRAVEDLVKRQKELGVVTQQEAEIAAKFNDTIDEGSRFLKQMFVDIGSFVLPVLARFTTALTVSGQWIRNNKQEVALWGAAIGILIAFTNPILALGAALILVVEDIIAFNNGVDSMTGRIIEKFPVTTAIINGLATAIKALRQGLGSFGASTALQIAGFKTEFDEKGDAQIKEDEITKRMAAVSDARRAVRQAETSPISSQTSNSIATSKVFTKNNTINIQEVNVQTQATNTSDIFNQTNDGLANQVRQAMSNVDDGVDY